MPYKIDIALYELNIGNCYCGVFMPKHVMKKIVKLDHKFQADIREILTDHKTELFSANWTMATAENKDAVYIKFTVKGDSVQNRIDRFKVEQPKRLTEVYVVDKYNDAEPIAKKMIDDSPERKP